MLAQGKYLGYLVSGATTAARTGSSQVEVKFNVGYAIANGGEYQQLPGGSQERTVFLSLHDNSWEYTEKKLKALGFNGDFGNPQFAPEASSDGIELLCEHKVKQGASQPTESWELASWGTREIRPAGADVVSRFNARWRSGAGGPPPAGRPTPPPAGRAPAPRPTVPRPDVSLAPYGRSDAWKEMLAMNGGKPDLPEFDRTVATVEGETSRAAADFGEDEWKRVAQLVSIPAGV